MDLNPLIAKLLPQIGEYMEDDEETDKPTITSVNNTIQDDQTDDQTDEETDKPTITSVNTSQDDMDQTDNNQIKVNTPRSRASSRSRSRSISRSRASSCQTPPIPPTPSNSIMDDPAIIDDPAPSSSNRANREFVQAVVDHIETAIIHSDNISNPKARNSKEAREIMNPNPVIDDPTSEVSKFKLSILSAMNPPVCPLSPKCNCHNNTYCDLTTSNTAKLSWERIASQMSIEDFLSAYISSKPMKDKLMDFINLHLQQ